MEFTLSLPDWAVAENRRLPLTIPSREERMENVIRFAHLNLKYQTGGPFAAGVFETATGRPVVIGVNRVIAHDCSSAHAEIMALSLAQKIVGTWNLGGPGRPVFELVVNWLPCAMCFGALLWSGVRSLVIAGSGPELESITGFDEGPVHPEWEAELARRGISLYNGVLTRKALKVFHEFAASGALVYNGRTHNLASSD